MHHSPSGLVHRWSSWRAQLFSNEPIVVLGGTLQEVFSRTTLAHSGNEATDYQRIADRFEALDFVDHDLAC